MSALVFDVETTGLPKIRNAPFRDLDVYDDARIVSIAWSLVDSGCIPEKHERYYVIRPDNFEIPEQATKIHGITNEQANEEGVPLADVIEEMSKDIQECVVIVAHNIMFDINVLRSELVRLKNQQLIDTTFDKSIFCTMHQAMKRNVVTRFTKLTDLYQILFPDRKKCENAHNAMYDVRYCRDIYRELLQKELVEKKSPPAKKRRISRPTNECTTR